MSSPVKLIDTHAHLHSSKFHADRDEVIERALSEGVELIILPATEMSEFDLLCELQEQNQHVKITFGTHPHSAATVTDTELDELPKRVHECKAIAIGEIGLDYYYDFAPRERQIEVFRRQLAIAKELDLPAVIHNRESDQDVLDTLDDLQDGSLRFQLHCFSSDEGVLKRALDLGGMISFTGNITFKNSTLDEIVRRVPNDRIMIETDSPFMTPVPHRGKRNEPSFVRRIAETISTIRNEPFEKIAQMTTENALRFFRLALILLGLITIPFAPDVVAQIDTIESEPPPEPYDKLFGIGPHLTSTTFIISRETQATQGAFGGILSIAPLQPIGGPLAGLNLDVIYTPTNVFAYPDSITAEIMKFELGRIVTSENIHNTLDIRLRYEFKRKSFINLSVAFGATHFYNLYGIDRIIIDSLENSSIGTDYDETGWGLGGGLGISFNFRTPIGTITPRADVNFSSMMSNHTLVRHGDLFQVSQTRISLMFYPHLSNLLGLENP